MPVNPGALSIQFPSSLVIPRNAKLGDALATAEILSTINCNNRFYPTGGNAEMFKSRSNPSTNANGTHLETSVTGIGLHWTLETPNGASVIMSGSNLNSSTPRPRVSFPYLGGSKTYAIKQVFKLVKIQNTIGKNSIINFSDFKVEVEPDSFVGGLFQKPLFSYSISTVQIETASCNLTSSSIDVPMGRVHASQFNAPGSTSRQVPFYLSLDCDPDASMKLTLDATNQVAGREGTISLTPSSTAAGVGIQILDAADSSPIPLGTPRDMGLTHSGINAFSLAARYIQVGSRVSPGSANGSLTFSLSYN
ncbi:Fimbrial protein [compost metagenome]